MVVGWNGSCNRDRKGALLSESREDGSESVPLHSPPRHCKGKKPGNEGIAQKRQEKASLKTVLNTSFESENVRQSVLSATLHENFMRTFSVALSVISDVISEMRTSQSWSDGMIYNMRLEVRKSLKCFASESVIALVVISYLRVTSLS